MCKLAQALESKAEKSPAEMQVNYPQKAILELRQRNFIKRISDPFSNSFVFRVDFAKPFVFKIN